MKKILVVGIILTGTLIGCTKTKAPAVVTPTPIVTQAPAKIDNTAFTAISDHTPKALLGLIINNPDEKDLQFSTLLEKHVENEDGESILIIPKHNGSTVKVETVGYEDGKIVPEKIVYEKVDTPDGYGVLLQVQRPEGIPQVALTIEYKGEKLTYDIVANGKEQIKIELLSQQEVAMNEPSATIIQPISDKEYVKGMNLFDEYSYDWDKDGTEETIGLYAAAAVGTDGMPSLDDGQDWALIARKGETIYPLFDRRYVQLGAVEYSTFIDYNDESFHILIHEEETAGMVVYDCTYDEKAKVFKKTVLYEFGNTNTTHKWEMR